MSTKSRDLRPGKLLDYKIMISGKKQPQKLDTAAPMNAETECEYDELDQSIQEMTMEMEKLDVEEKKLRLMLDLSKKREAVRYLQKELEHPAPASPPKASAYLPYPDPAPAASTAPTPAQQQRLDLDPQVYLNIDTVKGTKYRAVVDYIPRNIMAQDEEVSLSETVSLTYKSGSKPKLDKIQPAQWTVANVRILAEILIKDDVDKLSTTLDYLSYTAKMGEYATRYTWSSVIIFDDEYRRRQAQFGFRWGSDSPHSSMLLLRERERLPKPKYGVKPKVNSGNSGTCNNYNNGRECIFGAKCRFRHECEICGSDHPSIKHKKEDEPRKEE